MKKVLLTILVAVTFTVVQAQNGYYYIGGQAGAVVNRGYSATLHLDFPTRYYNSFELFASYYNKNNSPYKSYLGGIVYKPELTRNKNTMLKARLGGGLGSGGADSQTFILGPEIGLEYSLTLYNNIDLVLANKNQFMFRAKDEKWRIGFEFGIRFPL